MRAGATCPRRAVYGDPPKWCHVCDPSPEAAERRRVAGGKRLPPDSPEVRKRMEVRAEGTLDEIVRRALALATKFEKIPVTDAAQALAAQRITLAAARMYNAAIQGLKARGTVGDIPKGDKAGAAPKGTVPPPARGGLDALDEALDS